MIPPERQLRFPATTPRVSRSTALHAQDIIAIDAAQFADDQRRLVVGPEVSDEMVDALTRALIEIDHREGMIRWFKEVLAAPEYREKSPV